MMFHIFKDEDGKALYESRTFYESSVPLVKISDTNWTYCEVEDIARAHSVGYDFHLVDNNCQNWAQGVAQRLGYRLPTEPTNGSLPCECRIVLKFSANMVASSVKSLGGSA
jgi:hypothetical protein